MSSMRKSLPASDLECQLYTNPILAKLKQHSSNEMPTILTRALYRVYFYSHESNKPPHVHVDRDKAACKVWLIPITLSSSLGFKANELREFERLVSSNRVILLKAWQGFHG